MLYWENKPLDGDFPQQNRNVLAPAPTHIVLLSSNYKRKCPSICQRLSLSPCLPLSLLHIQALSLCRIIATNICSIIFFLVILFLSPGEPVTHTSIQVYPKNLQEKRMEFGYFIKTLGDFFFSSGKFRRYCLPVLPLLAPHLCQLLPYFSNTLHSQTSQIMDTQTQSQYSENVSIFSPGLILPLLN